MDPTKWRSDNHLTLAEDLAADPSENQKGPDGNRSTLLSEKGLGSFAETPPQQGSSELRCKHGLRFRVYIGAGGAVVAQLPTCFGDS